MQKLLDIVADLIQPQRTWGEFSRKIISLLTLSLLAFVSFDLYWNFIERTDKFIPLHEIVETDPNAYNAVKELMAQVQQNHHEIQAVWLYSWPDAANIQHVHHVGASPDPLPVGHFWGADAHDVGKLTLDICTELNRTIKNTACAIVGAGDTWGLVVVIWSDEVKRPDGYQDLAASMAKRISYLLYKDHD